MNRLTLALAALLFTVPFVAHASPHALPYTYPYSTLATGETEVEQYADTTPVQVPSSGFDTETTLRSVLVTEVEYGITDRLEVGLYFQGTADTANYGTSVPFRFDGLKQRLRYRLFDPGTLPIDVSIYGEIAELSNEIELEAKINLEKRFGKLQVDVNLWAEREFYYAGQQEWVLNPTAGASYEITPSIHLGLEYWMHAEYGRTDNANNLTGAFNPAPHHYIGPALLLQGNKFWWAVAPYIRLDDWGRSGQVGDQYGRFWVRAIMGIEL